MSTLRASTAAGTDTAQGSAVNWGDFHAQFWGSLAAGALLLPFVLYFEQMLDEWRELRHEKREKRRRRR